MQTSNPDRIFLINLLKDGVSSAKARAATCEETARWFAYYTQEAALLRRMQAWLADGSGPLPEGRKDWPCCLCDAEPGDLCDLDDQRTPETLVEIEPPQERFHHGRGFDIGLAVPGSMVGDRIAPEDNPAELCVPTAESGPEHSHRARCLGCDFRGPVVASENEAIEGAMDHVWPLWRELPVVPEYPNQHTGEYSRKDAVRWLEAVIPLMPEWWLKGVEDSELMMGESLFKAAGPPIRTKRQQLGTRHCSRTMPGNGFSMSAGDVDEAVSLRPRRGTIVAPDVADRALHIAELHLGHAPTKRASRSMEFDEMDGFDEESMFVEGNSDAVRAPRPRKTKVSPVAATVSRSGAEQAELWTATPEHDSATQTARSLPSTRGVQDALFSL